MSLQDTDLPGNIDYKLIEKRYYGLAHRTQLSRSRNPFEDPIDESSIVHLCVCAREGCTNMETVSEVTVEKQPTVQEMMMAKGPTKETKLVAKQFPRCPLCLTKYCSKECQIADHTKGSHKDKCRKFKIAKEQCEKTLCKKCWPSKWECISDFYPQGKISAKPYKPCKKCFSRDMMLDDHLPIDITSDPDIARVWLQ